MRTAIRKAALFSAALIFGSVITTGNAQDGVRLNKTIEMLDSGDVPLGILTFDYSLNNARSMARSRLDFIIIDMEHAPFDIEKLREFMLGMTDKRSILSKGNLQPDVVPIVRIPATGEEDVLSQAKQVLDVGAFGIMYPSVSTAEQTEMRVRATRYPQYNDAPDYEPKGLRGRNPSNAVWYWGINDYHAKADVWPLDPNGELLAIIQIETAEGVANIDEIIRVPGVGVIFIGPSDLATDMGYTSSAAPEVEAAMQTVLASCLETGVPCAITTSSRSVQDRIDQGFGIVTVGLDGGLGVGASEALRLGREASAAR